MIENTTGDMQDSQDNPEDTYPNAGRDSGYVAPVGEDLVNKLSILISGIETKLLLQGQQTRGDIAEIAKQQAQSDRARLLRNAEFQEHIDERFDTFGGELTKVAGLIQEVQSSQAAFHARLTTVEQRVGVSEDGLSALRARMLQIEDVNRRLDELSAFREEFRVYAAATRRGEFDLLKAQVQVLLAERGEYTPDERAQLISTLLQMIAEWRAMHPDEAGG